MTWVLAMLRWLASSRAGQALGGLAALGLVMAYRERKAAQRGAQGVTEAAKERDRDRARQIEEQADAARDIHSDDPVGRLRRSGLIRDRD